MLFYVLSNRYNYPYLALIQKQPCASHRDNNVLVHRNTNEKIRSLFYNATLGF